MADGLQVFGVSEKPPSAKLNKVARRVVIDVANAAALPTSPAAGMTCHLLDTNELFYFNGTLWLVRPKGWVSNVVSQYGTGNAFDIVPGAGTVEINGIGLTVTTTGHSFYRYTLSFCLNSGDSTPATHPGDIFSVQLFRSTGGTDTPLGNQRELVFPGTPITTANIPFTFTEVDFAPAATCSYHAKITAIEGNTGGGRIPAGCSAQVEHIGGIFLG